MFLNGEDFDVVFLAASNNLLKFTSIGCRILRWVSRVVSTRVPSVLCVVFPYLYTTKLFCDSTGIRAIMNSDWLNLVISPVWRVRSRCSIFFTTIHSIVAIHGALRGSLNLTLTFGEN